MSGAELQIVMRHQALQLQINDPILDDFYHHFWVVKGGQSKAKPLATKPAVISTERKRMDQEAVSASLGLGTSDVAALHFEISPHTRRVHVYTSPDGRRGDLLLRGASTKALD